MNALQKIMDQMREIKLMLEQITSLPLPPSTPPPSTPGRVPCMSSAAGRRVSPLLIAQSYTARTEEVCYREGSVTSVVDSVLHSTYRTCLLPGGER